MAEFTREQIRTVVNTLRSVTDVMWSCREPDDTTTRRRFEFVDPDGRVFTISNELYGKPRYRIAGDWPRDHKKQWCAEERAGEHNPAITVSKDRTPAAIAIDIARRFLPEFAARWDVIAERAADRRDYHVVEQWRKEHPQKDD